MMSQNFIKLLPIKGRISLTTVDSITDRQGNLIFQHDKSVKQVVPQEAAFQTLFAMQQTVERGTARSLQKITLIYI